MKTNHGTPSSGFGIVDPVYTSGAYYADPKRHSEDAPFKAGEFLSLFSAQVSLRNLQIHSYADVGCGAGEATWRVADGLRSSGHPLTRAVGLDVSPTVSNIRHTGVEYRYADITQTGEQYDLITLFDVLEHVPDPIGFLREVSDRCDFVGLHLPLDNNLACSWRNLFSSKLTSPGHLVFFDISSALNLIAYAGLRTLDCRYTLAFESGHTSWRAMVARPVRRTLGRINPWLLSRTLGGVSLMAIAATASGLRALARVEEQKTEPVTP